MQTRFKRIIEIDHTSWNIFTDGLTQSSIATFQQCPMKLDYKLKQRLTSGEYNTALDFGSLFHEVLDTVYTHKIKSPKAPWQTLCDIALTREYKKVLIQDLDPADMQKFEVLHGMAGVVLPLYFRRWASVDTKYKWVAVEKTFKFLFDYGVSKIPIRGKIDGIVEDSDHNLWLFEHKTKTDIDNMGRTSCQALIEKMGYELQVMVYAIAIHHIYGKYPKGVVYNLIKRPGQKFTGMFNKKPETIPMYLDRIDKDMVAKGDAYFCRYNITLSPEEIKHFEKVELYYWVGNILRWALEVECKESPKVSSSCSLYRKPCEFLPICSENSTSRFKIKEHLFPELVMVDD